MSRILVITTELGGNVPPELAIARELAGRGHDVAVAGLNRTDPGDARIAAIRLEALRSSDFTRRVSIAKGIGDLLRATMSRDLEREVTEIITRDRPQAVLADCMMLSAVRGATGAGVATAVLYHSVMSCWLESWGPGPFGKIAALRGLSPFSTWRAAATRLVVTDPRLDTMHDRYGPGQSAWIGDVEWVGTTETGVEAAPQDGGPPLVLVSLSSNWAPGQADTYRRIVGALGELPVRAIVTTGTAEIEGELDAPANVEVGGYVPHADILPETSLAIGHGGHSTTLRALAHGVPLLVMPTSGLTDQPLIGRAVEDAGAGRLLSRKAAMPQVRDAVAALLADADVTAAARALGERLRQQRGWVAASDRIESLALTAATAA